jgi:hypothetical protein
VELTVSRGTVIHIKSGHGVDPYFNISMPKSMKGWRKKMLYLRNNDSLLFLVFTGGHPIPQPSWGHGVARRDLNKL